MNKLNLIQMIMQGPQQVINKILGNNPMAGNLLSMINKGDASGIEQMARNLAKEKGQDADKLFNEVKNKFGI